MATDVEIERALATVTATLNDQKLDRFDSDRVQEIVTEALGGTPSLRVDDGGGLHDETGNRVGAIRRTDSGEWITERQNDTAERSNTAIPTKPPQGKLRAALTKLTALSGWPAAPWTSRLIADRTSARPATAPVAVFWIARFADHTQVV